MPDTCDWRTSVAQRVCTVIRDGRVRERFCDHCAGFIDEINRDEEQLARWNQRRKEHCLRGSHTLAELKARTAEGERLGNDQDAIERTRPAEDTDRAWIFDYYQDVLDFEDLARLGSPTAGQMLVGFRVWVPRELSLAASPKLTVPPLFGRFMGASAVPTLLTLPELSRLTGTLHSRLGTTVEPGPASWAEKYASLAAIHDAQFADREPIDELHYITGGRLTTELRRQARQRVRQLVDALPDSASASLLEWLADVEADLVEYVGPPARPDSTRSEQAGTGEAAEHERRSRAQQQLTAAIEDLLARFDTDGPYGADFIGPGPAAGDLAATLGFAAPPVEVIIIQRPDSHPVFDKHEHIVRVGTVRFNDPDGLTHALLTLNAFAEVAPGGPTRVIAELPPDMRAVSRARGILESWHRKVRSLNVRGVAHSPAHIPTRDDSLAIMAFKWRLGRELVGLGDPTPDEELFWHRKHEDAMKQGLRGVLNELDRIAGNRFQLVAKVNPTAGRKQTPPPLPEKEHAGDSTTVFRLVGAIWEIRFADERGNFPDRKGFQIVARLLRFPDEASQAVELQGLDPRAHIGDESVQETLDGEAVAQIRERLAEIDREIDQADENHDDATSSRLQSEREQLIAESAKALGLGGRSRRLGPSPPAERARIAVRQNLDRVYEVLRAAQPPMTRLADHLERFILTEGQAYAYRPETTPPWEL